MKKGDKRLREEKATTATQVVTLAPGTSGASDEPGLLAAVMSPVKTGPRVLLLVPKKGEPKSGVLRGSHFTGGWEMVRPLGCLGAAVSPFVLFG